MSETETRKLSKQERIEQGTWKPNPNGRPKIPNLYRTTITIKIDGNLVDQARAVAKREQIPFARFICRTIKEYFKKYNYEFNEKNEIVRAKEGY